MRAIELTDLVQPLRIIELAEGVAGPVSGRLFVGLGHDVVKCEPPGGDYLRGGRRPQGSGAPAQHFEFSALNAGKQSVVADIHSAEGIETIRQLLESADVVITDLGPVTMGRLGLIGEQRVLQWPDLVVISLSGFGLDSAWSNERPDSLLAESFGGLATMIGEPDRPPLALGGEQAAFAAGFVGFFGAMLALERMHAGFGGDVVDVALSDVAAYIDWKSDISFGITGVSPKRTGVRFGRWRMVEASDGLVGVIYQPEQWAALVALIGDERLADERLADEATRDSLADVWWPAVQEWARDRSRASIYEQAQRVGLPFGVSTDMADLNSSPQLRSREFISSRSGDEEQDVIGPFFRSPELGWRTGRVPALGEHDVRPPRKRANALRTIAHPRRQTDTAPLAGMLVLDLGTITAGAATGRLLADYGATVIKVESIGHPDSFRQWSAPAGAPERVEDPSRPRVSPVFESNNAGKLGVVIDLKTAEGKEQFAALVPKAHVVLENFRVGVTGRLGVDYASLRELNPELIYLSLSSQGQEGPAAAFASYGSTLDMLSGLASVTGYPGGSPIWSSVEVNYPDQLVSLFGAAIVAYCWNRGVATHIDVSQRETISWTLADAIADFRVNGRTAGPTGNRRPYAVPHDVYPCSTPDTWVAIACFTDAERASLASLLGLTAIDAADDDELAGLDEAIAAWTGARSRQDCVTECATAGVPCVPVLTAGERVANPHFVDRRVTLADPVRRKGFPLVLENYSPPAPSPAPELGEHTEQVLREFAGLSPAGPQH